MERSTHEYAVAMGLSQQHVGNIQQKHLGFHSQPQQFPQHLPPPPVIPPHLSLQQFSLHHQQLPQDQQHYPQAHLLLHHYRPIHLQQNNQTSPFQSDAMASPSMLVFQSASQPLSGSRTDPQLLMPIDKAIEYNSGNDSEIMSMIRNEQGNPEVSIVSSASSMHKAPYPPPFYEHGLQQQHSEPFLDRPLSYYDNSSRSFKGISEQLPSDVRIELNSVLKDLDGTKETINNAKLWFMRKSAFASALAEALKEKMFDEVDPDKQMYIIHLVNDILLDSLQSQANPHDLDDVTIAFRPVLGSLLERIYNNPISSLTNRSHLRDIFQLWEPMKFFDEDTVYDFVNEPTGSELFRDTSGDMQSSLT